MTYGFARNDETIQAQCPNCGRFPSEDDGFYHFIASEPDFISLFCSRDCCLRYEMKGGKLTDGDGETVSLLGEETA